MEQLPLVFVQSTIEPDIQECFTPAFNFTKLQSSNGRLAFVNDKVYWLPDAPMALLDQGWVINISEIESYSKYGISGFSIKLKEGKELRFSNVGGKMREGIIEAIESHKEDFAAAVPAAAAPVAEPPEAAPVQETTPSVAPAPAPAPETAQGATEAAPAAEFDPQDISSNKVMAVLSYLGILVLIPLLAAKDSKYARFHVNQGLILLICAVVSFAVSKIPGLAFIAWILNLAILILAVIGIINAVKGQAKELPYIGKYKILP